MTKIVVEELISTLTQDFTNNHRRTIKAVRLWLYKHLQPSGNFYVTITQESQDISTTESITSASFTGDYSHGFVTLNFADPIVLLSGDFTITLSTDYTFSESAYIGWIKPHENNPFGEQANDLDNAFGIQFWEYR